MKEFLEEDFLKFKGMVKDLNKIVFEENKKGFNVVDSLALVTFGVVLDTVLHKINEELKKIKAEEKDEGNS